MPRHRTPHPTDGDGIGRKLTGVALVSRLNTLADSANKHHAKVQAHWKGLLDHARLAGEALIEAKRRLGHKTKWSKWRRDHFEGSKETACNYMRVAREWNDPRIQQATASGVTIDSINKFLQVLRGDSSDHDGKTPSVRELEIAETRDQLRQEFANRIKNLDYLELQVLLANFESRSWPRLLEDLKQTVCQVTETEYYDERAADKPSGFFSYDEEVGRIAKKRKEKREVRSKVSEALNGKRGNRKLATSRS